MEDKTLINRLTSWLGIKRRSPVKPGDFGNNGGIGQGYMTFPGWNTVERDRLALSSNNIGTAQEAIRQHIVFRSISAIANEASVARLKVVKRKEKDESDEEVINHPFEVRWEKPNPMMGRTFLVQFWTWQLLLSGEAYLYVIPGRGKNNEISEIWPVPSWWIAPRAHPEKFIDGFAFSSDPSKQPEVIPSEYICYSRLVHPFDLRRGLSPLAAIMTEVTGDLSMGNWNKNFFGKENATPTGLVSVPRDTLDQDLNRIRTEIVDFFGSGQRRVAVARSGDIEWTAFDRSQNDMQFLQGRQYNENAILKVFGIPEGFFAKDATRANADGAKATFIENAVYPHLVSLAEDLNAQIMHRYYDDATRAQFVEIRPRNVQLELQEHGAIAQYLTLDEMRARFQYPPIGDVRGLMLMTEINRGLPMMGGAAALKLEEDAAKKTQAEEEKLQAELAEYEKRYLELGTIEDAINSEEGTVPENFLLPEPEANADLSGESAVDEENEEMKWFGYQERDTIQNSGKLGWYKAVPTKSRLAVVHEMVQWQRRCHQGVMKSRIPAPRRPSSIPTAIVDEVVEHMTRATNGQDVDRIFNQAIREYIHESVVRTETKRQG